MEDRRTSIFENGLIWFGAAVSIAEIVTGTYLAELGFKKGLLAVIVGHIIGCLLLFFAGVIGGKLRISSMEVSKLSFGKIGGLLFCVLNVIQLVGWTGIMIYDGALSASEILGGEKFNFLWCIVIGALIIVWLLIGIKNLGKINTVAMGALFVLSIILFVVIFKNGDFSAKVTETMSFGAAVELSVAMPLSWLPLICDYTKDAKKPVAATAVSAVVYGVISTFMYVIGMGAAIFTSEIDIAKIMVKAGVGIAGLLIIVFSTVTTTFLDAYSAGISSESIYSKVSGKMIAIVTTVLGVVLAIFFPLYDITEFLYFIGSVFAPMIAIEIVDYFIFKREKDDKKFDFLNLIIFVVGFIIYRCLMKVDIPVGCTLPDMLLTGVLAAGVGALRKKA